MSETRLGDYRDDFERSRNETVIERVFILGAGFSRDFGYTTADSIVRGVLSFYEGDPRINVRRPNRVYDFPWHSWHLHRLQDLLNLSGVSRDALDLYSFLHITSTSPLLLAARNHFFSLLTDYMFSYLLMNQVMKERYVRFIKTLRPSDAIITFNWDVIPECLMRTQDIPFTRHEWVSDRVMIVKMHGSLDLFSSPSAAMRRDFAAKPECFEQLTSNLWRVVTAEEYWPWPACSLFKRLWPWMKYDKSGLFIIPPYKTDGYRHKYISYNWDRAQQLLELCRTIVVVGYSFPNADERFARLLRVVCKGREKTIELWNPDPRVRTRLRAILAGADIGGRDVAFSDMPLL